MTTIHYITTILHFDAKQPEIMTASLNKPRIRVRDYVCTGTFMHVLYIEPNPVIVHKIRTNLH